MGLVATWLNGIGLNSAVPTFTAAGIVTPTALAELDVAHFEALGVTDPEDRRKLFYLVQRIKLAVDQKDETAEKVDAVLSGTNGRRKISSKEKSVVTNGRSSSRKSLAAVENGRTNDRPEYVSDDESTEEDNDESDLDGDDGCADDERSSRNYSVRRSKRIQAKQVNNDDNRRHQKKDGKQVRDDDNHGYQKKDVNLTFDISATATDDKSARNCNIPTPKSRHSVGTTNISTNNDRKSAASSSLRRKSTQSEAKSKALDSDSASEATSPRRQRKTGLQGPRTRRGDSKLKNPSKSARTGKRLSTIPSESIAPMSPLFALPTSKLDEDNQGSQEHIDCNRRDHKLTRNFSSDDASSSVSGNDHGHIVTKTSSDSETRSRRNSDRRTSHERSRSNSNFNSNASDSDTSSKRRYKHTNGTSKKIGADVKSEENVPPCSSIRSRSNKDLNSSKTIDHISKTSDLDSSVTIHGMGNREYSWKSQISRLREDLDAEYDLFDNVVLPDQDIDDMRIRVAVRKRPMTKTESGLQDSYDIIHPLDYGCYGRIMLYQPKTRVDLTKEVESVPFAFDNVFDENANNVQIYDRAVRNLIPSVFNGQWATVFAYGQTGSGKTYTMMGSSLTGINDGTAVVDESNSGLYFLAAIDVFNILQRPENGNLALGVSMFEIYGGKLFDLLNERNAIKCLEDSRGKVCFPGLSEHPLSSPEHLMEVIEEGAKNRSTGSTSKNADSSRSHAVLQLHLRKSVRRKTSVEHGRLTFIDLAGSERGADTYSSSHATRLEGAEINTSLLALKEVIRALATGDSMKHVPFRGSKLTQVLKEGFVGKNSRSVMIACISPNINNCEQTLNTLRYADRVKERNSDTGALPAAAIDKGRRRTSQMPTASRISDIDVSCINYLDETMDESVPNFEDTELREFDSDDSVTKRREDGGTTESHDGDSQVLNDILDDSFDVAEHEVVKEKTSELYADIGTSEKRAYIGELVDQHKSAMSAMLGMVKDEMVIVNKADSDRYDLDQYLVKLETFQREQLSLISKLRGSIQKYNGAPDRYEDGKNEELLTDDSFEDLRD